MRYFIGFLIAIMATAAHSFEYRHYIGGGMTQKAMSFKGERGRDVFRHNLSGLKAFTGITFDQYAVELGGYHSKWAKNGAHKHRMSAHFVQGLMYIFERTRLHPFIGFGASHVKLDYVITKKSISRISVRKFIPRGLAGIELDLDDLFSLRLSGIAEATKSLKHEKFLPGHSTSFHAGLVARL